MSPKMLETREMLNMLHVFVPPPKKGLETRGNDKFVACVKCFGANSAKNTQTFNIFNSCPVLSRFREKHLAFPLFGEPMSMNRGNTVFLNKNA